VADDNIIQFPLDKIVRKTTKSNSSKAEKQFAERIKQKQTKEFCDTAVDDISMNVLRSFVDLALKTQNQNFTKDLALLIDVLRGLIYRDFNINHPAQRLVDKLVKISINKQGAQSAKIDYTPVLEVEKVNNSPISKEVKKEIKDINDQAGMFEGDDLDE
tara:strand:+ start:835 stop:1311 length:477 start_codon:yes stop_codon:yes gene_type:complete